MIYCGASGKTVEKAALPLSPGEELELCWEEQDRMFQAGRGVQEPKENRLRCISLGEGHGPCAIHSSAPSITSKEEEETELAISVSPTQRATGTSWQK